MNEQSNPVSAGNRVFLSAPAAGVKPRVLLKTCIAKRCSDMDKEPRHILLSMLRQRETWSK